MRRNKFMNDIKENAFSVAVQNALSLKIDGLSKFEIESIDKDSIEFVWEVMDNNHYDGLIIEERIMESGLALLELAIIMKKGTT